MIYRIKNKKTQAQSQFKIKDSLDLAFKLCDETEVVVDSTGREIDIIELTTLKKGVE